MAPQGTPWKVWMLQVPGACWGDDGAEACQTPLPEQEERYAGERPLAQVGQTEMLCCVTASTGPSFPIRSVPFSLLHLPVLTQHLWIQWKHKHQVPRSKAIPQCCAQPLEQAARHSPKCRRHCLFDMLSRNHICFQLLSHPPASSSLITRSVFPTFPPRSLSSQFPLLPVPSPHSSLSPQFPPASSPPSLDLFSHNPSRIPLLIPLPSPPSPDLFSHSPTWIPILTVPSGQPPHPPHRISFHCPSRIPLLTVPSPHPPLRISFPTVPPASLSSQFPPLIPPTPAPHPNPISPSMPSTTSMWACAVYMGTALYK